MRVVFLCSQLCYTDPLLIKPSSRDIIANTSNMCMIEPAL